MVAVLGDVTDQKRAEDALRESREHLLAVVETTPACIKTVAADGTLLDMNSAGLAMVEAKRPEEVKGQCIYGLVSKEYQDAFREFNERVCQGEKGSLDFELVGLQGTRRQMETYAVPLRGPDGDLVQLAITLDVSERKKTEQDLKLQARVLESMAEGVSLSDEKGIIVYTNPAEDRMFGYGRGELVGQHVSVQHTYPPEENERIAGEVTERLMAEGAWSGELSNRRNDGSEFITHAHITSLEAGGKRYFVCVHEDITERKRVETALADARSRLDAALEAGAIVTWTWDILNNRLFADHNLARLFNLTASEAEGGLLNKYMRSIHPEDVPRVTAALVHSVESGEDYEADYRIMQAAGSERWVTARGRVERDERSRSVRMAGVLVDITEFKRMEEALRDASRRKDEFLATLAHELRNPLAPIRNSLEILKMPGVDAEMARQTREMIERQVHHLVRLVDDLLDVSRVMRGKIELRREPVELATVVARAIETVQPLIEAQGHRLNLSLPHESLLMDADPMRLAQVVGNLLTNAAKYTEANGQIWLTAAREHGEAVLKVRDNGIGIGPDMLPHIFELFVQVDHAATRSQGGLGIGLTLVKNLVEMHSGSIEAYSAGLGLGCEFTIRLPLTHRQQQPAAENENHEQKQVLTSGQRLLVVDDNQDAALSLAMLLRLQGHEVQVAHSGLTALDVAKSYLPHVVFLDIGMPDMDGYEVARRIRQQPGLNNVVLAALTGWGQQEDRRRTSEAGFNHHLVKPPEPKAVESVLASLPKRKSRLNS